MMNVDAKLAELRGMHTVLEVVDLSTWSSDYESSLAELTQRCRELYQDTYQDDQRIVFVHTKDYYVKNNDQAGLITKNLQLILNNIDISNYFVVVLSTTATEDAAAVAQQLSSDPVPITWYSIAGEFERIDLEKHPHSIKETYQYGSANPLKISLDELSDREKYLLTQSKTFCMYPWIHLHAWPTGQAFPCCHAKAGAGQVGNCRTHTMKQIWNSDQLRKLRTDMLSETPNAACGRCYEQENSGFFSGRQSANKHHGHHIDRVNKTHEDGHFDQFELTYWDVRFSNLCNLKCRSCGHVFSSQWYQDQAKLTLDQSWKEKNSVLNYAGRTETDMWEQLEPHLDYVEQIYFAGGEPLLMEEHYRILDELVKRKKFDVRLTYNTNFTHTDLKGKSVFEYWKQFNSVAVGASLDDSGTRGEYMRKGTDWAVVEQNRRDMLRICPEVDFYISPTLSIMNAMHLTDFHRDWVEKGLLKPQDLNVNILQDPVEYRIDIATPEYKQQIKQKFEQHLEWLRPQDPLQRATVGFESAINYLMSKDNSSLIPAFWSKTEALDDVRQENILDIIPELKALK
jgi:MoaA/NifB/PqqE/SkfB family radical SAM enzyme